MLRDKNERETKVKSVDMKVVTKLLKFQSDRNRTLEGTKRCTLHPKTSEPCTSCPYAKECKHYVWERDYIHKHKDANIEVKRRKHKDKKGELPEENFDEEGMDIYPESEEDVIYPDEEKYPCKQFSFSCSNKDECQNGKACPWVN